MKKYFYRTVYVIAYTRTENTQTIKHIMIIDFDSIMVNLVTVMLIWLHVNFDCLHGFPHTHWTFPGTGVNVSVKRHLKGQFSFILQLWFCCFVWFFFFHLWLQGCLNYGVITHTSRGDGVWLVRAWAEQTLLSSHSHTSSCHWSTFSLKQQFSHSAFIRPDLLERSFRLEPAGGTVPLFM